MPCDPFVPEAPADFSQTDGLGTRIELVIYEIPRQIRKVPLVSTAQSVVRTVHLVPLLLPAVVFYSSRQEFLPADVHSSRVSPELVTAF